MHRIANVWYLAQTTFIEGIRHKALWAIVALAALFSLFNIVVTEVFTWDLGKVSIEFGLSAFALTGLLLVFFLALKILVDDIEGRSIHMILCRPVTLWQYAVGKFCGLCLVLLATAIIMGLSTALSMHYVLLQHSAYVPPDFSWLIYTMALASQWMGLVMLLAVSFFFFCFASHHFVALVMTVFTYLVGQNMEILRRIVEDNPHAGILANMETLVVILSWIFPNLSLFDKKTVAAYGLAFSGQEFMLLACYCVAYSSLLLYFSTLFLARRDFS